MIDISSEAVVTLTEATHHLPRRRKGKRPAVSTIFRWAQHGCRGIRLETIQVGGSKCTSIEALQRFFDRLTAAAHPETPTEGAPQVEDHEATERELDQLGI